MGSDRAREREGKTAGEIQEGERGRVIVLQGKRVSSYFLQALIKARNKIIRAAISMLYYREMTIDSVKPTSNYSCF